MTLKRTLDLTISIAALLLLWPLFAVIAVVIRVTSPGPIIFRQTRAGYRGKAFTILKFRTMKDGSGRFKDYVTHGDDRVTAIGTILRRTHLDELPQFLNVLSGEMSLVGPRPMSLGMLAERESRIPNYRRRLDAMPGITGLAQIRGRPTNCTERGFRNMFLIDLFYIRRQCFLFDLSILIKTFGAVCRRQGV